MSPTLYDSICGDPPARLVGPALEAHARLEGDRRCYAGNPDAIWRDQEALDTYTRALSLWLGHGKDGAEEANHGPR